MGAWGFWLFGEEDSVLVKEIAKLHHLDEKAVEEAYRKMLESFKKGE